MIKFEMKTGMYRQKSGLKVPNGYQRYRKVYSSFGICDAKNTRCLFPLSVGEATAAFFGCQGKVLYNDIALIGVLPCLGGTTVLR